MTALSKYARLEATGLWRADPAAQRREVVVSLGDATLVIKDMRDQALTHWSLAALERANPGVRPAIFHPDGDAGETLELPPEEAEMIQAIEILRKAVNRARPRPGRLRWLSVLLSAAVVVALAVFWLPGAMRDHTLNVVPQVKRVELGQALLGRIERVSGPACKEPAGVAVLAQLAARLGTGPLVILPQMTRASLHLPGDMILLNRSVIEDFEEPDIAAGFALTEQVRSAASDPLSDLLQMAGLRENFRLLTTGEVSSAALDAYAEHLMMQPPAEPALPVHLLAC